MLHCSVVSRRFHLSNAHCGCDYRASASGGVTLHYDPVGRLVEYDTNVSRRFVYDGAEVAAEVSNPRAPSCSASFAAMGRMS
jgi:hypothetical protein